MKVNGEILSLETRVYPIIKKTVNIPNKENISKIE